MCYLKLISTKEELAFREILREVKERLKPVNDLLENPEFERRTIKTCLALTRDGANADDLYQEVSLKVAQKILDRFTPDYEKPFGKFFEWLRPLARCTYIDQLRAKAREPDAEGVEDLSYFKASGPNPEILAMRNELFEHIEKLPKKKRLATQMFLKGYSLGESKAEFLKLGISCSRVTIRKWVSAGLKPFCSYAKVSKALFEWKAERKPSKRSWNGSKKKSTFADKVADLTGVTNSNNSPQLIKG